jgi:NMD protein affecting ribosome stability and mRNA decay
MPGEPMTAAEYERAREMQSNSAAGLCVFCGSPHKRLGSSMCQVCYERIDANIKARHG